MAFTKFKTTKAGKRFLLSCMDTGDFQIHSLVLGSGEYSGDKSLIEDVVTPEIVFTAEELSIFYKEGRLTVQARFTNEQLESKLLWREYGVYVTDGTTTLLYCYDNAGDEPVPIATLNGGPAIDNILSVELVIDEDAVTNIQFTPPANIETADVVTESGVLPVTGAAVYKHVAQKLKQTLSLHSCEATIPATGWSSASPYSIIVPVEGLLETDYPSATLIQTGDEAVDKPMREAWGLITRMTSFNDYFIAYAAEGIPAVDIPIKIKVVR